MFLFESFFLSAPSYYCACIFIKLSQISFGTSLGINKHILLIHFNGLV